MIPLQQASGIVDTRVESLGDVENFGTIEGSFADRSELRMLFIGMDVDADEMIEYMERLVGCVKESIVHDLDPTSAFAGALAHAMATAIMAVSTDG